MLHCKHYSLIGPTAGGPAMEERLEYNYKESKTKKTKHLQIYGCRLLILLVLHAILYIRKHIII